ncbi:hypothetical protein GGR52DRAFT_585231 [Hypoxylon sp. FL1284]|nr:hypothetical protein GGR52DRAFT_585231 [Hypoxylon sp. FL1284]
MSSSSFRSSFGVELEFVIAVQFEPCSPPPGFDPRTTGPVHCDRRMTEEQVAARIKTVLTDTIRRALQNQPSGDRVVASADQIDGNSEHLREYTDWVVKRDATVVVADNDRRSALFWHDVEVTSPALWATSRSYAEVHRVVRALTSRWWAYAPASAGLHVHYGWGADWISFAPLRQLAAFLYAADPVLAQMHGAARRGSEWCPSNRWYNALAHGTSFAITNRLDRHKACADVEAPPVDPDDFAARHTVATRLTSGGAAGRAGIVFRRGELPGYEFDREAFEDSDPLPLRFGPREEMAANPDGSELPLQIGAGVLEILRSTNAPSVAVMMQGILLSAYNFEAYSLNYREDDEITKRTVEFRQAQGTLDADEVVAHATIAVVVAEFACRTDVAGLLKITLDLAEAEENPEWYDVFDLLGELGLEHEARVIQRRHARERGIKLTDEQAGRS